VSIFDLFFLALVAALAIVLLGAVVLILQGKVGQAGRLLVCTALCFAAYMAVVVIVSALLPRRTLSPGQDECFDDWCIAVNGVTRIPKDTAAEYRVDFRISSRALRVEQRERNLAVYLTDDRGKRFDPQNDSAETPFSVLLHAGDSVATARTFLVPPAARELGLVITHEGGFPIGWFIIGYNTWFRKPPVIPLASIPVATRSAPF
jgi:hypothetical protein